MPRVRVRCPASSVSSFALVPACAHSYSEVIRTSYLGTNYLLWGRADGTLVTDTLPITDDGSASVVDFDHDGNVDLLWFSPGQNGRLLRHDGNGTFVPSTLAINAISTISGLGQVIVADLDNDGDLDVVTIAMSRENTLHAFVQCPDARTGRSPTGYGCVYCPTPSTRRLSASMDVCIECGEHAQVDGSGQCAQCLQGFERFVGASGCTACPAGSEQPARATACQSCTPGKYAPFDGSITYAVACPSCAQSSDGCA